MGLQEQLDYISQASDRFANSAKDLRQQSAGVQLGADLRQGYDTGDFGAALESAIASGDSAMARQLLDQQAALGKAKASKSAPYTLEQLNIIAPQEVKDKPGMLQQLAGLSQKEQNDLMFKTASNVQGAKKIDLGLTGEARRQYTTTQGEVKDFTKDFDKEVAALDKEDRALQKVKAAFQRGQVPDDAILFNFIARSESGEKGPLSEGDVSRIIQDVFSGRVKDWQNFLSGGTTTKLSSAQRETFNNIVQGATGNLENYKQTRLGRELNNALVDFPRLGKDRQDVIIKRAERNGFKYNPKDKTFSYSAEQQTAAPKNAAVAKEAGSETTAQIQQGLTQIQGALNRAAVASRINGKSADQALKAIQAVLQLEKSNPGAIK
jgi:hypothetical protein